MILVTGAAGFVGRHLVERLIADGRRVRCLLPERQRREFPWQPAPEIVRGNVLNEEALFRAVSGVHTIIHLENAQWWGRPRDLERIELVGTRNLITAARAARVGRIITLSHLGASPAAAYTLLRIKGMVEEEIRASGLACTVLRSGIIFGLEDAFVNHIAMMLRANPFVFLMPGRGEVALHPIHIDDIVQALFSSLEAPDTVDAVLDIGGPEYITLEDLIRTVMRVSGTPRFIIPVPPYAMRWLTAVYSRLLPRSLMTAQWLDLLATNRTAPLGNIFNYFGIKPRRFEDTLLTYMRGRGYLLPMVRYTLRRRPRGI
jgi:NADH dehydrogenase